MRERSLREARAIARLNHANVVRIFDVLRTDGDPWIVMEYVASKSLQDTLAEDGPVSPARAVEIGLGVLGALKRRAQGRRHAPRRQAGQRAARRRRPGGADRFRPRHHPGRPERHPHRHGARLARVHRAGAGPGRHRRAGGRPVVAGRDALRGGRGQVAVRPAVGDRHPGRAGHRAAAAGRRTPARSRPCSTGLLRKDPNERITAEVAERMLRRAAGKRPRGHLTARWRTPAGAERSARAAPAGGAGARDRPRARPARSPPPAAAAEPPRHRRRGAAAATSAPPECQRRRPSSPSDAEAADADRRGAGRGPTARGAGRGRRRRPESTAASDAARPIGRRRPRRSTARRVERRRAPADADDAPTVVDASAGAARSRASPPPRRRWMRR